MGGPKALMTVGGEVWWRRQERAIDEAGLRSLWVVSPEVQGALEREPDAPRDVALADPEAPMFESVIAGVRALAEDPPEGVFILPVDVPAPGRPALESLARTGGVATPRFDGRTGHPLHMPWGWVRERLLDADPPERRLDRLIGGVAEAIDVDDRRVLVNLNTPADLQAWLGAD